MAGDEYSLAEPGWWPWIVRMPADPDDLAEYPAVVAWCERLARRPSTPPSSAC